MTVTTDHYSRRIKIAERAVVLAKQIDRLTAAAIKLQDDARKGQRDEVADTGASNASWEMLTSDFAINSIDAAAIELRRAAVNAGAARSRAFSGAT